MRNKNSQLPILFVKNVEILKLQIAVTLK